MAQCRVHTMRTYRLLMKGSREVAAEFAAECRCTMAQVVTLGAYLTISAADELQNII